MMEIETMKKIKNIETRGVRSRVLRARWHGVPADLIKALAGHGCV